MSKQVKQKLCWNCEGSVATTIENCPYCGVYLSPDQNEEFNFDLLKPPYPLQEEEEDAVIKPPYTPEEEKFEDTASKEDKKAFKINLLPFDSLLPLLSLTTGTVFALFAIALYLFSENGMLTLQWNADYWYLYALIAVPAFCIGCYSLQNIKEEAVEET